MQFLVIGRDGIDSDALNRRLLARERHLKLGDELVRKGHLLHRIVLFDNKKKMIGSALVFEFPNRKELDSWLAAEPYVIENVWEKIEIFDCMVGKLINF